MLLARGFRAKVLRDEVLPISFAVLNLLVVLFMNRPAIVSRGLQALEENAAPGIAYRLRWVEWLAATYANIAGLDNRWQMFGRQSRFNWWFTISARYADGRSVALPLPLQSPRDFWQRHFFDFKESKFQLNLYGHQPLRRAYADYLCRRYAADGSAPIRAIAFELRHQMLVPPEQAARLGSHLQPQSYSRPFDELPCR